MRSAKPRSNSRQAPKSAKTPKNPAQLEPEDWSLQRNIAFQMASVIFRMDQDLRDSVLRGMDLTYAHFRVLQVLYERDGQQIGDIARAIVVRQPVLSRVIDQMETRDLARREADPQDNRIMRVFLTDFGRQQYMTAWPSAHPIIEKAFSVITPAERAVLADLLQRIDRNIER